MRFNTKEHLDDVETYFLASAVSEDINPYQLNHEIIPCYKKSTYEMINRDKPLKKRCLKDLRHAGSNSGLGIRLQGDLRPSRRLAVSSMSWCKHPSG